MSQFEIRGTALEDGAMPFWYFLTIPPLPPEVSHQSNLVEVRKYLLKEGDTVEQGTPIVTIENYWALMQLRAKGSGVVKKILFDLGTTVAIGDPVAIIGADGEALPQAKINSVVEILEIKRSKEKSIPG